VIDVEYCRTLTRYGQWMNQKVYAVCEEISDAERRLDRGAFFGSIHCTHHRGQLTTLLGHDVGATDLTKLPGLAVVTHG